MNNDEYEEIIKERDEFAEELSKARQKNIKLKEENMLLRQSITDLSNPKEKSILDMTLGEILDVVECMKRGVGKEKIVCKED